MKIEITHRGTKVVVEDDGKFANNKCSLRFSDQAEVLKSIVSSVIKDINESNKQCYEMSNV